MSSLRDRLENAPLPDSSGAEARAWAVVADANSTRPAQRGLAGEGG